MIEQIRPGTIMDLTNAINQLMQHVVVLSQSIDELTSQIQRKNNQEGFTVRDMERSA
jgi:hypothetical protein